VRSQRAVINKFYTTCTRHQWRHLY